MGGPIHPPQYQALYRACIKDAAVQGAALMRATLIRALQDMPERAARIDDVVERNLLLEAAAVLREQQHALADAFPQALLAEFTQAIAGDRASSLSFESLLLLGDEQVQDNAQVVRAAQELQQAVAPQLARLEALLAAAEFAPRGQRHPLKPEVYVRSLHRLARQSPVSPSVRRRWLPHLAAAMGPELAASYDALAESLRTQGLGAVAATGVAAEPAVDASTQVTIRELRKLLAADLRPPPPGDVPVAVFGETEFPHTLPDALTALQDMRKVDQVMLQLRQRQAAMPGAEAHSLAAFRAALRQQAHTPAQALGLEVVHQMVENLAGDPRLLPPVQRAVRELEPALLRLALSDPRFFSDRAHPARRLLEQVTQRSLAWSSTDAAGFREFAEGLDQAVEALLDNATASAQDSFEIALVALRDAWEDAQPRGRRVREKAVRALMRAEQRNLLAEHIGRQLLERRDAAGAPREVLAFLSGPWAQVMAHSRLSDTTGATDPGGRERVATLVLWSVQPALAGRVAAQHTELVHQLEEGLSGIEHSPAESHRWLELLAQLREFALSSAAGAAAYAAEPAPPSPKPDAWLAPLEAHDSGFVSGPGLLATWSGTPVPEVLPPFDLQPGAWVDLLGERWERWQLTWSSPHGMLFMFTHAAGATRSMTRHRLQQMLAQGAVRLVSAQAVVDGALDAVAHAAWQHSALSDSGSF